MGMSLLFEWRPREFHTSSIRVRDVWRAIVNSWMNWHWGKCSEWKAVCAKLLLWSNRIRAIQAKPATTLSNVSNLQSWFCRPTIFRHFTNRWIEEILNAILYISFRMEEINQMPIAISTKTTTRKTHILLDLMMICCNEIALRMGSPSSDLALRHRSNDALQKCITYFPVWIVSCRRKQLVQCLTTATGAPNGTTRLTGCDLIRISIVTLNERIARIWNASRCCRLTFSQSDASTRCDCDEG